MARKGVGIRPLLVRPLPSCNPPERARHGGSGNRVRLRRISGLARAIHATLLMNQEISSSMTNAQKLVLLTLAALPAWAAAQDIFRCVDAEGRVTLQNTGGGHGCKRLNVQPILSVSAPPSASRSLRSSTDVHSANFPKIDSGTQRARDDDRKRILEDELKSEEQRLASVRGEYNNGTPQRRSDERDAAQYQERVQRLQHEIRRGEDNIASLKREIALLQRQ
jgi:hypothetical protein